MRDTAVVVWMSLAERAIAEELARGAGMSLMEWVRVRATDGAPSALLPDRDHAPIIDVEPTAGGILDGNEELTQRLREVLTREGPVAAESLLKRLGATPRAIRRTLRTIGVDR